MSSSSKYPQYIPYMKNYYSQEMIDAVVNYMSKGSTLSPTDHTECEIFEEVISDFTDSKYAISTNSGTSSLHIALLACDIGQGDEVILTPHVAYAVGNAVLSVGSKPLFVDIDEKTLTMDPMKIEDIISQRTKAIIPVHTYGHPANMDSINKIARRNNLFVIEDLTHAFGSRYKGKRLPLGGEKNIGIISFNWKQLWLPAGGGMIITDSRQIREKAALYRKPYSGKVVGFNYLMHNIAAIVGKIQLQHIQEYVKMQRENARLLSELLDDTPVITPYEMEWGYHSYARYAIRAPPRDKLMMVLNNQKIECKVFYPTPTHLLKLYKDLFGYKKGDFPITEQIKTEELALPEPRFRNREELKYIAEKIKEFYD